MECGDCVQSRFRLRAFHPAHEADTARLGRDGSDLARPIGFLVLDVSFAHSPPFERSALSR